MKEGRVFIINKFTEENTYLEAVKRLKKCADFSERAVKTSSSLRNIRKSIRISPEDILVFTTVYDLKDVVLARKFCPESKIILLTSVPPMGAEVKTMKEDKIVIIQKIEGQYEKFAQEIL